MNERGADAGVLYVEDSELVGRVIVESLKFEGIDVVLAPTAADAIRELEQNVDRFALVLCDHKLPDMTGLELLTRIRSAFPSLRLVLATGYANASVKEQARRFDGLLIKPFAVTDVIALLPQAGGD